MLGPVLDSVSPFRALLHLLRVPIFLSWEHSESAKSRMPGVSSPKVSRSEHAHSPLGSAEVVTHSKHTVILAFLSPSVPVCYPHPHNDDHFGLGQKCLEVLALKCSGGM